MSNFDRLKPFAGGVYPEPWVATGHAYATDRAIVARVPSDPGEPMPVASRYPPATALSFWAMFPLTTDFVVIPELPPVPPPVPCESCNGDDLWECPECDGDGAVTYIATYGQDIDDLDCPVCDGDCVINAMTAAEVGWKKVGDPTPCEKCGGLKGQPADESVVKIGGLAFAPKYLRIVAAIPGVMVAVHAGPVPVLLFAAGDLQGVLMSFAEAGGR